jgi:hypothetical protein
VKERIRNNCCVVEGTKELLWEESVLFFLFDEEKKISLNTKVRNNKREEANWEGRKHINFFPFFLFFTI